MPLSKRSQGLCELCCVADGEVAQHEFHTFFSLFEFFEEVLERARAGSEGGLTFHAPILVILWHFFVSSVCEDFLDLSSKKVVEGVDDVPAFTHVRGFVPEDGQLMPRCKTSIPLIDVFDSQPIGAFLGGERRNLASMISLYVKKDFFHRVA